MSLRSPNGPACVSGYVCGRSMCETSDCLAFASWASDIQRGALRFLFPFGEVPRPHCEGFGPPLALSGSACGSNS